MLLSLATDQHIDRLKMEAALRSRDLKLPHSAAQKLQKIMMDDQIQPNEFSKQFEQILASTKTLNWKIYLYLNDIKGRFVDQINQVSWSQVFVFVSIFSLLYFLYKKFKLRKQVTVFYEISYNVLERILALLGYFVPIVVVYQSYLVHLLRRYPTLHIIYPNFMQAAVKLYTEKSMLISYGYFFGLMLFCISLKYPRSRFVRFHTIRGLFFFSFQGIPDLIYTSFQTADVINNAQRESTLLFLLAFYASLIIPCLYQALTHTYPKNSFIREAIEVQLGRDNNEDFKWWDRN